MRAHGVRAHGMAQLDFETRDAAATHVEELRPLLHTRDSTLAESESQAHLASIR